jgi:tetratricopeptide (TPR) repeat protein
MDAGQHRLASGVAGNLSNLLWDMGHLEEALATVDRKKNHTRRAGLGPWTQLGDEVQRLQLLNAMGRQKEVLAAVETWREQIKGWPEAGGENELVEPWRVKEILLQTGWSAALDLKRWQEALSLNQEIQQARIGRGPTALEMARTRYNDYGPLLRLERYDDARDLLYDCLAVFESEGGSEELGLIHSAIANLETELGHFQEAVRHQGAALRFRYSDIRPEGCAISHFNLANSLNKTNAEPRVVLAHRLASTLIRYQTNEGRLANTLRAMRGELSQAPANFDELCRLVEQTEGVRFRELFSRLPQRAASGDEALQAVLALIPKE